MYKLAKLSKRLERDIMQTAGSVYRMNAPYAVGYGCEKSTKTGEIAWGLFQSFKDFENEKMTYFLNFKNGKIYTWK